VPFVGDDSDKDDDLTKPTTCKSAPGPNLWSTGKKKATMKGKSVPKFGSTARRLISAAALGSDSEDSEDTALSAKSRRLVKGRNKKRRKLEAKEASLRSSQQMEQLIAVAGMIASATQVQTEDNQIRLERDFLKRSLVKT
jgi:hypothetical protein